MPLTRSQTNRLDDEERRRFLNEGRPTAPPVEPRTRSERAAAQQQQQQQDPDALARALLGIPEPRADESAPQAPLDPAAEDTSPWRRQLDAHLRRRAETEQRAPPPGDAHLPPRGGAPHPAVATDDAHPTPRGGAPRPAVTFNDRINQPGRTHSVRSAGTNNTEVRRREAELEAAERLAAIRREQLRIEEELIQKRLAVQIDRIEEQGSRAGGSIAESTRRVDQWLRGVDDTSHSRRSPTPQRAAGDEARAHDRPRTPTPPRRNTEPQATPRRRRSPSPQHHPTTPRTADTRRERSSSRSGAIERLADHIENMARPPPRQVYELPTYSGEPHEWLTFYNSYVESSTRYKFSEYENLSRLRYALKGDARQCVQHMLASFTKPELVMRILKKNFGRTDLLIDRALEDLRRLPPLGPSASDLNGFSIKVMNIVSTLVGADQKSYGANPLLIREITEKLSPHLRSRWCAYARINSHKYQSELLMMAEFLLEESDQEMEFSHARAPSKRPATAATSTKRTEKPAPNIAGASRRPAAANPPQRTYTTEQRPLTCLCCGGAHRTTECQRVADMNVGARWDWARSNRICFRCLESKHRRDRCRSRGCGEPGCPHTHHKLLHEPRAPAANLPAQQAAAVFDPERPVLSYQTLATSKMYASPEILLKIVPILISGPKGELATHALLDEGSTISLIDERLAAAIGAVGPEAPLAIKGIGTMAQLQKSFTVRANVRGTQGGPTHALTLRTVRELGLRGQRAPKEEMRRYTHLMHLEAACYDQAVPYVLIGADHWHIMVPHEARIGRQNEPAAVRTDLGWVIYGTAPRVMRVTDAPQTVLYCRERADAELKQLLKQHFSIDALGVSSTVKTRPEHERAQRLFEATVRRIDGPHYEVGQLWREDDPTLPPNFNTALSRLRGIERKIHRDPVFATQYEAQIQNLLDKGYAEQVTSLEPTKKDWYLPHFAVTNPNKPGKIRLVFDAAAETQGRCLNDYVLEGPDLLQPLPGILYRFREGRYACTADLAEMFLQIRIREEDRPSQMFLWRGMNQDQAPSIYQMKSMLFGAASSPYLAHSVRNKNAEDNKMKYPTAVTEIQTNHYMDDFVSSFGSEQECVRTACEVAASHKMGGFTLRGWNTNSRRLVDRIPPELLATGVTSFGDKTQKILGMLWDNNTDELGYNTTMIRVPTEVLQCKRAPTKREMLSSIMSIFDPLGLISQHTITAKIQLQRLWALDLGWDERPPPEETEDFQRWLRSLDSVATLRIPRQYLRAGGAAHYQLHIFVDASEQAYAVAAYWRIENSNGVALSLAAAKAKVAPTKPLSIPRLELQAALLGARLQRALTTEHRLPADSIVLWTDSRTVLHWVRDDARRYSAYVAHRLGEIAELTEPAQWRWVPTRQNPADDATRADPDRRVDSQDRWYTGPPFLLRSSEDWPQEPERNAGEAPAPELKASHAYALTHQEAPLPDVTRFSSYERLIRATARVFQFIDRVKTKTPQALQMKHVRAAEHVWLQHTQRQDFPEELRSLARGESIATKSRLFKLNPHIADDGLLRMRGRINAAPAPNLEKNPAILDGRNPFVRLLIAHEHRRAGHANNERVVNDLRQRYWVLHLRPSVRAVAIACRLCAIRRALPQVPALGDLPPARLQPYTRPFTYAAVDYFGPINVTIGRRHEKRWVALFTCLTTRAVHLELVHSLSTSSAIMALRRMAARRGYPRVMYSDNATNFRGADVELRAAFTEWLPALQDFGLRERMEWRFIPPGAPNQGGAWERMVRSIKTALSATLHTKAPKEEELQTLLAEAENSVNARPLTHVSVDPRDPEALTPQHFLLGGSAGVPLTGPCDEADRRTWRAAQALADHFWARWVREYLPTLAPRQSSASNERPLQVGDYVVIVDAALPRNVWPRGIVEAVFPGPDGAIRSANVRTKGGVFHRPTRKLAVLPVQT